MNRGDILENLTNRTVFPAETLTYCLDHPQRTAAIFLPLLGKTTVGAALEPAENNSLYLGIHLLATLKVSDAFPLLLDLATQRPQLLFQILGEVGIATTLPRVLMCLANGRAEDLWQGVQLRELDFLIRDAFLRAWTYEVLEDRISAAAATTQLREYLDSDKAPAPDDPIWSGWLIAIADLGFSELEPVAERAVRSGRILADTDGLSNVEFKEFETALMEANERTDLSAWLKERGYSPFGAGPRDWGDCFVNAPQSALSP